MAVRGYALRAAKLAGAAAGPVTSVALLIAGCALLGVAAAGGGGAVVAIVLAAVLVAIVFACCDRLALSAMLARPVSEVEHPELYRLVRELSKDGRLPVPRLYLSPSGQPNSFAVGRGPRSAAICCTEGLLEALDEAELRGVLGHELAHVSGRDVLASTASAGLAIVITFPAAALASALRTIDAAAADLPLAPDARSAPVAHLMMASPLTSGGLARLFLTHPPAGERIRRLEALAGYRR